MKNKQIRTSVRPEGLARIPRLLGAGTAGIVAELFENARRADADLIEVWTNGGELVVTDDGWGVADPKALLAVGGSVWAIATVRREEPAGLGLYSLAERGCRIESRTRDGEGFEITLEPRHFRGEAAAQIRPADGAPSPHGTRVSVPVDGGVESIVTRAARYLPVDITLNGAAVEQGGFLDGAERTEEFEGVEIGVFRRWHDPDNVNFHGRLIRDPGLPRVSALAAAANRAETWTVRVDAVDAPGMRVDPGSGRLAAGDWLDRLRNAALAAVYRAIGESAESHVEYERFAEAARLGVALEPPPPALPLWRPGPADPLLAGHEQQGETLSAVAADAVVVGREPGDPADQAAFGRALRAATASGAWKAAVYRAVPEYEGYEWYDRLPRITGVDAVITAEDGTALEADLTDPRRPRLPGGRPAGMTLKIEVTSADREEHETRIGLDLLFGSTSAHGADPRSANILVAAEADISADDIAACCQRGYFNPDAESPPWDGGDLEEFVAEATAEALRVIGSAAAGDDYAIRRALRQHVAPRVADGRIASIEIDRRMGQWPRISLRMEEANGAPDAAGRPTGNGRQDPTPAKTPATSSSGSPPTATAT